jgi:hypothetical protein
MGEPGVTGFATTPEAVKACGESRSKIFQGLQVAPHPVHGYRGTEGLYELTEDTPVASATALANPHVTNPPSAGGLPQYYIPDWQSKTKRVGGVPLGP